MTKKRPYDTPLRIVCTVLFAAFSFLYIYLFQGELLALVQDHLSKGQTTNNTLVTALIVTLLLMLLQYLLNRVGKLHGHYEAISYLPSCVLLALMTKVDSALSYSWLQWIVALSVVAFLYLFFAWIARKTLPDCNGKFLSVLTPNLGVMVALFIFTGWYGNNSPAETMELAAWNYVHSGEYDKVLVVGKKSEDCNAGLTALRNLSLAKKGQLDERLFAYPQPYGSDGLMMNRYNVQTPKYGSEEYYSILGSRPYGGETAPAFYKRMWMNTDSVYYRDLYTAALLLDKDLATFATLTAGGQSKEDLANAPVHYQEAWIIYNEQHPFSPVAFTPDDTVRQRYQEYVALRNANAENPVAMQNLCKRRFGNTYWYYYDFVH